MPLCLADEKTCIVLAGDHLQMTDRVYSAEARQLDFDKSATERLDNFYVSECLRLKKECEFVVRLRVNYRNKSEIAEFMSSVFYNDTLVARSEQPSVHDISPLNFFETNGREIQDQNSTSIYNWSEVNEVAIRVIQLINKWPHQLWGPINILVTTAYSDQVSNDIPHSGCSAITYCS